MKSKIQNSVAVALLAATVSFVALPAFAAMNDAECAAAFTAADVNKDGVLTVEEGARYHAATRIGEKTITDGKLTQAEFLANCKAGLYDRRAIDAGAPLKGANSFTETQAQDRALSYGLATVSALKKDADGIWRGTAQSDGKPVSVAIDFKGNVVVAP